MSTPDEDLLVVELFQVAVDCRQSPLVDPLALLVPEPPVAGPPVIAAPPELGSLGGVPVPASDVVAVAVAAPEDEVEDDPVVDEVELVVPAGVEAVTGEFPGLELSLVEMLDNAEEEGG